jgi:hypothetical protein
VGLLVATQQQKGIVIGSVIGVWALLEGWYDGGNRRGAGAIASGAWFAAGVLSLVAPLLMLMVGTAGIEPVLDSMVRPYAGYLQFHDKAPSSDWGWGLWLDWWHVQLLRALPLAIVPVLVRARRDARRDATVRPLLRASVVAAAGLLSIVYKPDGCHLAVAALVPIALTALAAHWLLSGIERLGRYGWLAAPVLGSLAVATLGFQLARLLVDVTRGNPVPYDSVFGRIDLPNATYAAFSDKLRAMLHETGTTEIFAYPMDPVIYLWTGARNATRFQVLLREYSRPEQFAEVVATLSARKVRYLVIAPWFLKNPRFDPIVLYARNGYRQVDTGRDRAYWLFERRDDLPAS